MPQFRGHISVTSICSQNPSHASRGARSMICPRTDMPEPRASTSAALQRQRHRDSRQRSARAVVQHFVLVAIVVAFVDIEPDPDMTVREGAATAVLSLALPV
jgi:hypothetical protein